MWSTVSNAVFRSNNTSIETWPMSIAFTNHCEPTEQQFRWFGKVIKQIAKPDVVLKLKCFV